MKRAKEQCGYNEKPTFPVCGNCGALISKKELPAWMRDGNYPVEKYGVEKLFCADHKFSVKKTATCKLWRAKE